MTDYYELLQISPNADADTVHRVYRFLAARVHPDQGQTGDAELFRQLKTAYDVLSDPVKRTQYDMTRKPKTPEPFSNKVDFMDQRDGELNRRLAVLAVLYHRRRNSPNFPEVALAEIEERMGFPRDYLDFTMWYLGKKGYLLKADNAMYALSAEGVDFVESERSRLPILNRLLTSSTEESYPDAPARSGKGAQAQQSLKEPGPDGEPIILPASMGRQFDRRVGPDRRVGAPDLRKFKLERRSKTQGDRRGSANDRRDPS